MKRELMENTTKLSSHLIHHFAIYIYTTIDRLQVEKWREKKYSNCDCVHFVFLGNGESVVVDYWTTEIIFHISGFFSFLPPQFFHFDSLFSHFEWKFHPKSINCDHTRSSNHSIAIQIRMIHSRCALISRIIIIIPNNSSIESTSQCATLIRNRVGKRCVSVSFNSLDLLKRIYTHEIPEQLAA